MMIEQEIKRFWEIHDRVEGYHSSKKQIVPRPSAKVPNKKQTNVEDRA